MTGRCDECVVEDLEPTDDDHNVGERLAEGFHLLELGQDDQDEPVPGGLFRIWNGTEYEEVSKEELESLWGG